MSATESATVWIHEVRDRDRVTYRLGRRGQHLVAEWPDMGRVTCRSDGSGARVVPAEPATSTSLAMLHSTVTVFVGELCGGLGLHASAVSLGGRGVLLLGQSGSGKSTAAAAMCAHHGAELLADDAALIVERNGDPMIEPSEREHHLNADSLTVLGEPPMAPAPGLDKAVLGARAVASTRVPLALIAALRFDDTCVRIEVQPLKGIDAASRLLASLFRFNFPDAPARRNELDRVMRVHECTRVLELRRPRSKPDVVPSILEALLGESGGQ